MFRRLLMPFVISLTGLWLISLSLSTPIVLTRPLGRHCGDVGPLPGQDPNYCGCTWGEILFRGQPVPGAIITLSFGSGVITNVSRFTALEPSPYFDVSGYDLGARRGDLITLTATFAGQIATRTFRAWPDTDGEQHIALALAELGAGQPLITGGYTHTLASSSHVVWAGGLAGVISIELTSGISVAQALPWNNSSVRVLAIAQNEHVWAGLAEGLAEFDPGTATWYSHTVPFSGVVRALGSDLAGAIWAGGDDGVSGYLAVYTGTWMIVRTFSSPVTALTVDGENHVWVGTYGDGAYRKIGEVWTHYQDTTGLASDYVLAAVADTHAVWFGTEPYFSGSWHGGITRYDLSTSAWRAYGTVDGLPADPLFEAAPAAVDALSLDENGRPWAGTIDGVRFLVSDGWWSAFTSTHGLRAGAIHALSAKYDSIAVAGPAGLDLIDQSAATGSPPVAEINSVTPLTLTLFSTLTLNGAGQDADENGARLIAWDWASSLDGPLCTTPSCALPYERLTPGDHVFAWRAEDDEGQWSNMVTRTVKVLPAWYVYLPAVARP